MASEIPIHVNANSNNYVHNQTINMTKDMELEVTQLLFDSTGLNDCCPLYLYCDLKVEPIAFIGLPNLENPLTPSGKYTFYFAKFPTKHLITMQNITTITFTLKNKAGTVITLANGMDIVCKLI